MEISKIDEKGRLLIPKRVRIEVGLKKEVLLGLKHEVKAF